MTSSTPSWAILTSVWPVHSRKFLSIGDRGSLDDSFTVITNARFMRSYLSGPAYTTNTRNHKALTGGYNRVSLFFHTVLMSER